DLKESAVTVANFTEETTANNLAFVEGIILANYQFLKYKKEADKLRKPLSDIHVHTDMVAASDLEELKALSEGVFKARDLVNEPLSFLTAPQLSKEIKAMSEEAGFSLTVFKKSKIKELKMGGLLAVNYGSVDPPRFNILEWKPENAVNEKPIVLVGKGVVYDTGGLSLKPTVGMDIMKCDMAGAAAVACTMYAVAKNKLPIHLIVLVPATDNRPGKNAYVPGDVIKMYDGSTVEVLNTDAEGRMILADALAYAKQYDPELVIDIATLTGASLVTIGAHGMLLMTDDRMNTKTKQQLVDASYTVKERLAELPIWAEHRKQLDSDIADLKNIGGRFAGSITAGAFLKHFTDYPWMHIDMAPMGWSYGKSGYRPKGGAGTGVRLFYQFLKNRIEQEA
ncbi:MAG: leucyl aminopeptidase family protein, partial [Chitinophagales bacterium]